MRISGIGDINPLSLAASALGVGGGSSGGAVTPAPSSPITVSPSLQTSISPQISPVFVQTGAGSTGTVTAGTSMTSPTAQGATTGAPPMPGAPAPFPAAAPYSDIGYPYGGVPNIAPPNVVQTGGGFSQYLPYAIGAIALITIVGMMKKKSAPRYRGISRA